MEADSKDHLVQPFLANNGLDKMAEHPTQLNFKSVQHWAIHHFLGWLFQFLLFPFHRGTPQLGRSQPALHSRTIFSQMQDLVGLDKILSLSLSLSRFSCRVASLPKSSVCSQQQKSSEYTWSYFPRHLCMQRAALSPISLPGDPLWQVVSLEQSNFPARMLFWVTWSASSPPTAQATCLDHKPPVSPGGGCGKP